MSDENATKNEDQTQANEDVSEDKAANQNGESGDNVGADSGSVGGSDEQGISYGMIMETLQAVQANQAKMSAQIQKLSDAQSVLVDAGAVVREGSGPSNSDVTDDVNDGFVSIDELDLNL